MTVATTTCQHDVGLHQTPRSVITWQWEFDRLLLSGFRWLGKPYSPKARKEEIICLSFKTKEGSNAGPFTRQLTL